MYYTIAESPISKLIVGVKAKNRKKAIAIFDERIFGDSPWIEIVGGITHNVDGYGGVYRTSELAKLKGEIEAFLEEQDGKEEAFAIGQIAIEDDLRYNPLVMLVVENKQKEQSPSDVGEYLCEKNILYDYYTPIKARLLCNLISEVIEG